MDLSHFLLYNNKLQHRAFQFWLLFDLFYKIDFYLYVLNQTILFRQKKSKQASKQAFLYVWIYEKSRNDFLSDFLKLLYIKNASIANMNEEQRLNCRSLNIYRKYRIGEEGKEKKEMKKKLTMSSAKRPLLISFNATRIHLNKE